MILVAMLETFMKLNFWLPSHVIQENAYPPYDGMGFFIVVCRGQKKTLEILHPLWILQMVPSRLIAIGSLHV